MANVFNFIDYREYLETFYNEQKGRNKAFSYQYFANKAGFKSKSFLKLVIDGKKNLSSDSIQKLNSILKLNGKSFSYFADLVAFNQAKSVQERNFFFDKIAQYNKRSSARTVLLQQYDIYSRWYYNAIRELVITIDFKDDFELLGKMLKPAISARKVSEAVKTLERLGFIEKKENRYIQCDPIITTGDEVRSLAISNFHIQNLVLAMSSIDTVPSSERDISCLVLGLSDESFGLVKNEIKKFRKKLLDIAASEKKVNRVYHINFQALPVSEVINANE
ncbi:MAG: TIGR02147 family protein [Chitinispirillaceae bacterium]|nr:TIGR02147 family protein [Chitinispirillaceae bacterium]